MRIHSISFGAVLAVLIIGCSAESSDDADPADGAVAGDSGERGADAAPGGADADAGPCTPGPASLVCRDSETFSLCTDDADFDGTPDGPDRTVEISCADFFRNVGSASCETVDADTTEATCTMDDGGPCGVILITGGITTARCTTDDAVCLLDLEVQNYVCTPGTGIVCPATGDAFVPFCDGARLVWRCSDDGDGIGQPHVDDCAALGNGTCNAAGATCTDIEQGGRCNLTEWLCAPGLKCEANTCVPL